MTKIKITTEVEADELRKALAEFAAHDPAVNFWEAVNRFESRFASKSECKSFMDTLFATRDEECWMLFSEVEQAIAARHTTAQNRGLRAVS